MFRTLLRLKARWVYRAVSSVFVSIISFSLILMPVSAGAEGLSFLNLPKPGSMLSTSPEFTPVLLKGLAINPSEPLRFDFIIDSGNSAYTQDEVQKESERLIKYFLASLTVPENDLWVNLSPYEQDRMITDDLGRTELGRDLLAQDYVLKQLTASLIYPEKDLGKEFWARVYKLAQDKYGTTEIPVNTFNKVWVLPETATVFEKDNAAYVVGSRLKVMLDEDYVALSHQKDSAESRTPVRDLVVMSAESESQVVHPTAQESNTIGSQIVREIVLPEITKEVNEGKNFAPLRQIYHSLILAKWYKETIKESLFAQLYFNQNKTAGVEADDKTVKDQIYAQYVEAYKKGVFNYIKEDFDEAVQETVPRKYFSGGINRLMNVDLNRTTNASRIGLPVGNLYKEQVNAQPQRGDTAMLSFPGTVQWYIKRLKAPDNNVRWEAMNKLVEKKDARAKVPFEKALENSLPREFFLLWKGLLSLGVTEKELITRNPGIIQKFNLNQLKGLILTLLQEDQRGEASSMRIIEQLESAFSSDFQLRNDFNFGELKMPLARLTARAQIERDLEAKYRGLITEDHVNLAIRYIATYGAFKATGFDESKTETLISLGEELGRPNEGYGGVYDVSVDVQSIKVEPIKGANINNTEDVLESSFLQEAVLNFLYVNKLTTIADHVLPEKQRDEMLELIFQDMTAAERLGNYEEYNALSDELNSRGSKKGAYRYSFFPARYEQIWEQTGPEALDGKYIDGELTRREQWIKIKRNDSAMLSDLPQEALNWVINHPKSTLSVVGFLGLGAALWIMDWKDQNTLYKKDGSINERAAMHLAGKGREDAIKYLLGRLSASSRGGDVREALYWAEGLAALKISSVDVAVAEALRQVKIEFNASMPDIEKIELGMRLSKLVGNKSLSKELVNFIEAKKRLDAIANQDKNFNGPDEVTITPIALDDLKLAASYMDRYGDFTTDWDVVSEDASSGEPIYLMFKKITYTLKIGPPTQPNSTSTNDSAMLSGAETLAMLDWAVNHWKLITIGAVVGVSGVGVAIAIWRDNNILFRNDGSLNKTAAWNLARKGNRVAIDYLLKEFLELNEASGFNILIDMAESLRKLGHQEINSQVFLKMSKVKVEFNVLMSDSEIEWKMELGGRIANLIGASGLPKELIEFIEIHNRLKAVPLLPNPISPSNSELNMGIGARTNDELVVIPVGANHVKRAIQFMRQYGNFSAKWEETSEETHSGEPIYAGFTRYIHSLTIEPPRAGDSAMLSVPSKFNQQQNVGGIDMNQIDLKKQGNGGADIQFDSSALQELLQSGVDGFAPVIINITPIASPLPVLGLNEADPLGREPEMQLSGI